MILDVVFLGRSDDGYWQYNAILDSPSGGRCQQCRVAISPKFQSFRSIGYRPIMTRQLKRMFIDELICFLKSRV